MPTTPSGTRTVSILSPLGRLPPPMICPTGSGSFTRSRTASAMSEMRAGVSRRRSCIDAIMPFSFAAARSFSFSASTAAAFASSAAAIAVRAAFRCPVVVHASTRDAARARFPVSVRLVICAASF